jgi:tetratricopeptide (TPR) repeat protein
MARKRARPAVAASSETSHPRQLGAFIIPAALIVVVGLLTYSNALSGPFIRDDYVSVVSNQSIRDLFNWRAVLAPAREFPTAGRPLVNLSLAVNYALGGLDVRGYHLWNLAIHLACAVLVFAIVRETFRLPKVRPLIGPAATDLAAGAALLWVVHPLNSEVVNYITQRSESTMAFFYLLTLFASIRAIPDAGRRTWEAAAVVSCALGMGCKESMVTAPVAVVLYDRIFVVDSWRQMLGERWRLYAGLAAGWLVLAVLIGSGPRALSAGFDSGVDPWTYLLNQSVMLVQYLKRIVWPRALVANYGWPVPLTLADVWWQAAAVVLLAAATAVALVRWPLVGFAGAWFFLTLAPTSSIVPIATEVGAERRMYLPLISVVVLAVAAVAHVGRTLWGPPRSVGRTFLAPTMRLTLFAAVVLLALMTMARNREYRTSLGLARTVVERWPTGAARHVLGEELLAARRPDEAIAELRAAVPDMPRAHFSLGMALFNAGSLNESIEHLQAFVDEEPLLLQVPAARLTMARAYARQDRWPLAAEQARLVLAMKPDDADARGLLADAMLKQGDHETAIRYYREYLQTRPADPNALINLGLALVEADRADEALTVFRQAVIAAPNRADARRNLATALFERDRYQEASSEAGQALTLEPQNAAMHVLLGRSSALQRNFDAALGHFKTALTIDPSDADARTYLDRLVQLGQGTVR